MATHAGECRYHCAQERGEASDEDVDRAATAQPFEGAFNAGSPRAHDRQRDQPSPVSSPDLVAHRVTDDRRDDDEHAEGDDVDVPFARDDARDDDRGLTGQDEADEERCLAEDEHPDEAVDQAARKILNLF